MNQPSDQPEAYFHARDGSFLPTIAAASPWDADNLSGVAIGGLLAHVVEQVCVGMAVARLTVDILGTAPRLESAVTVTVRREGSRIRLLEAELSAGGRVSARAGVLLVRVAETPVWQNPVGHAAPEAFPAAAPSNRPGLGDAIERRIVHGGYRDKGPGAMWARLSLPMVAGVPLSPLVRAAMLGDMGSAIGSVLAVRDFTFANLDIAIHFSRMPVGDWLLIDALTDTAGDGHAVVSSTFSDRNGVYARGHQTLFVAPRG